MDACQNVSLYCKGEATITAVPVRNVLKDEDHFNMLEKTLSQGQRQGSTILYTFITPFIIDQVFTKFVSDGSCSRICCGICSCVHYLTVNS